MSCARIEDELRRASDAYYNGNPIMSDHQFDELWRTHEENRRILPDDPVWKDTILDKVGARPPAASGFNKVRHSTRMQSLDNAFVGDGGSLTEIHYWLARLDLGSTAEMVRILVEPKIDGLSLRLVYKDGQLLQAATRGDGEHGDDVTANVRAAKLVPERLVGHHPGRLEINGEVFMTFTAFQRLNVHQRHAGEEPYSNPRNAAAGILRRKNPDAVKNQGLSFLAHGVSEGALEEAYSLEVVRLQRAGFKFPDSRSMLADGQIDNSGKRFTLEWFKELARQDYPTDGAVLKVDLFKARAALGSTSRAPRWAVALKFEQEEVETVLKGITIQVGRSGILTPVAELEPVEVDGTIVGRATLHNQDQVERLQLRVGDKVLVRKAGAIIPEIVRSITAEARGKQEGGGWSLLEHIRYKCPACGSSDIAVRAEGATAFYCQNTGCRAQLAARIEHMASRKCLNLDGLGTEACDAIAARAEEDGVTHPFDILSRSVEYFASLHWTVASGTGMTFGESRAARVVEAAKASAKLPLNRWVASLGIPTIGENTSKELSRLFMDMPTLVNSAVHEEGLLRIMRAYWASGKKKVYEELKMRYGISHHLGPVSISQLVEFCAKPENRTLLKRVPISVVSDNYNPDPPKEAEGPLSGKTFVITGTLSEPRKAIQALIEANGGKVSGSISKTTSVLVAGDWAGSKMKKANDLGVEVWNEDRLRKEVNDG